MLPVFAKDWLQQPQKVMDKVWRALGEEGGAPVSATPASATPASAEAPAGDAGKYDHLEFRRLVRSDAGGELFWEAATDGRQLVVRRGRTGSKGQIMLRTFPDEGSAQEECNRQREEQIKRGYEPR